MKTQHWRDFIVRTVESKDEELLGQIAQHLDDCEQAKSILRSKGYGVTGQSVLATARLVPDVG